MVNTCAIPGFPSSARPRPFTILKETHEPNIAFTAGALGMSTDEHLNHLNTAVFIGNNSHAWFVGT